MPRYTQMQLGIRNITSSFGTIVRETLIYNNPLKTPHVADLGLYDHNTIIIYPN